MIMMIAAVMHDEYERWWMMDGGLWTVDADGGDDYDVDG